MSIRSRNPLADHARHRMASWNIRVTTITIVTAVIALSSIVWVAVDGSNKSKNQFSSSVGAIYPVGVSNHLEPSGMAPPGVHAMKSYTRSYVSDFTDSALPSGWDVFTGVPGGDAGGQFASSHVVVSGGLLRLNTYEDPAFGDKWVTGGLCQCLLSRTYGAYFVRSRETGLGPNEVELLWPATNQWPPEIDFNESSNSTDATSSTVHYSTSNYIDQRSVQENMTKWHTWGVIWTPKKISYVVDGHVWGTIKVAYEIPHIPMTLDFEQRTMCTIGRQCPKRSVSLLIDWVAEYSHNPATKP